MARTIISQGKTTNEAIENGLKELKVSKDMVEIKVIEEEKRSFYNILAPRVVKVELTVKEGVAKKEETAPKAPVKEKRNSNKNIEEIEIAKNDVENFLKEFLKEYEDNDDVIGAILCGSYATGNQNEYSDIDVQLILKDTCDYSIHGVTESNSFLIEYFINPVYKIKE